MDTTYTIENTFNELKEKAINSTIFYSNEYNFSKWETRKIIWKIIDILWSATSGIYNIEKTDENYLKYINKILKAYKKTKKYTDLLTY